MSIYSELFWDISALQHAYCLESTSDWDILSIQLISGQKCVRTYSKLAIRG